MDTRTRTTAHWFTVMAAAALGVLSIAHDASAGQQVTIIGATAEETVLVEWAIDRYDTAGIEVRPITVVFHRQEEGWKPCNGPIGYDYGSTRTVHMCNPTRPDHERRRWMLHQLGHVYIFDTMSHEDIQLLVQHSHSPSWNDDDHKWQDPGQERAADLVAWGLNPDPVPVDWMQDLPCEQRADLFHTLTGLEIAHDECQIPAAGHAQLVTVHSDEERSHQLVDWVRDLYNQAGLTIPATDVYFHSIRQPCLGYAGLHTTSAGRHRIDVCMQDRPKREHTILHEFAHAWAHTNLTDDTRQAFLARRGLETWHDSDTDWEEQGTEHAAEIIAWGLNHQCRTPGHIGDYDPATFAATFEFLTGTQPICETDTDNSGTPNTYTNSQAGGPQA